MLILTLYLIFSIHNYKYRYYKNKPFPFESKDKSLDNLGEEENNNEEVIDNKAKCLINLLGNGNCDEQNNILECNYDDGDCCAASCIENCNLKKNSQNPCLYTCGANSYECKVSTKCQWCVHGTCKPMENCMKDNNYSPIYKSVRLYNLI